MKNIIKTILATVALLSLNSCVSDDDFSIPTLRVPFFQEDFQDVTNNTNVDLEGWTNYAEEGSWVWREKIYSGNGYAEFSAYNSGADSNIVWLITPGISLASYDKPVFKCAIAQHHLDVDAEENSLQVLLSTDFDGTNVTDATWTTLDATIPTSDVSWYEFLTSTIDLSAYSGSTVYIAFKFRGSGNNTLYDGAFQVDDVLLYNEN